MEEPAKLSKAVFEFVQEAHCNTSEEYEELQISFESSLGLDNDGEGFFVLKTESWSLNDETELKVLFDRILKIMKNE